MRKLILFFEINSASKGFLCRAPWDLVYVINNEKSTCISTVTVCILYVHRSFRASKKKKVCVTSYLTGYLAGRTFFLPIPFHEACY